MTKTMNKVCLLGRAGQNPEIRAMQDGKEMASFSIATSEVWKGKGTNEPKKKTEWHKIAVFSSGLVGVVKAYVKKGTKMYIEGSLQTRKWTGTDGLERVTTEVVMQGFNTELILLDGGGATESLEYEPIEPAKKGFEEGVKDVGKQLKNPSSPEKLELAEELDDEVPF